MVEGKRQKQVAGLLNKELSDIFQRLGYARVTSGTPYREAGIL